MRPIYSTLTALILTALIISIPAALTGCSKKERNTATSTNTSTTIAPSGAVLGKNVMEKNLDTAKTGAAPATTKQSLNNEQTLGAPQATCITLTYKHKKTTGHDTDETCGQHRNLLKLQHETINKKAICAKVDGTPVRFELTKAKTPAVVIGPYAGPNSKITVQYCLGKAALKEDCTIPKDEFMDAIGATEDSAPTAQWDNNEKVDDVTKQIDGEVMRELASDGDLGIFDGWIAE
jgi:hypothetical protein